MRIAVIACFGLLMGCEDDPPTLQQQQREWTAQQDRIDRRLANGLGSLIGQGQQAATTALGYPSQSRVVMGDTVYTWERSFTFPATENTGAMTLTCMIEIGVGPDGIIKTAHYNGLCNNFAGAFPVVP